jgi:hypothetical protein
MGITVRVAALGLAATLAACADEPVSPFGPGQSFTWNANQWSVSDRPDLGQLQIVADTTYSTGLGTARADRYETGDLPQPVFTAAVQGWFLAHGRHCTVTGASTAVPKTYVFSYNCWVPTYNGA